MNLDFVAYYKPYSDLCIGLFELKRENNLYLLKYRYGFQIRYGEQHSLLDKIDGPVYFVNLVGHHHYRGGFPFKPEYFNCVMNKEELREYLLSRNHKG
jgi:hypothetical protein